MKFNMKKAAALLKVVTKKGKTYYFGFVFEAVVSSTIQKKGFPVRAASE